MAKISEQSGKRNSRNLIEWKAINLSDSKLESSMKTTFISEDGKKFNVIGKSTRNGEVVKTTSEFIWHSELPEEHRSREAKKLRTDPE